VLLVSGSVGGGHDGVAAELTRRLEADGATTSTVDFLDLPRAGVGWIVKASYQLQLRFAPWAYELLYRLCFLLPFIWVPVVMFDTAVSCRRFGRVIRTFTPDVVVSVYPLSSLVLGRMRAKGWLRVPVITYLTDASVHPLWLHPGVDLHLAVSSETARTVEARGIQPVHTVAPLVSRGFDGRADRERVRREMGIPAGAIAVLVVAGSWGVGSVIETVEAIAGSGRFHPVCVCGRNEHLHQLLNARGWGTVIGWTDRMAELMAACDVVVENAGGLTCMEAFSSGLPVVTYRPIPGHGRHNAETMEQAGIIRYARTAEELINALEVLGAVGPKRQTQVQRARALFHGDASHHVASLAASTLRPAATAPFHRPLRNTRLAAAAASLVLVYGLLTSGTELVTGHGLGVQATGPALDVANVLGVRLSAEQLSDPVVERQLLVGAVPVLIDARTADAAPTAVTLLSNGGVTFGNIGSGQRHRLAWTQAQADTRWARQAIDVYTGHDVGGLVAGRRVNAFDLAYSRFGAHQRILRPVIVGPGVSFGALAAHRLYLVDATSATPGQAGRVVEHLAQAAAKKQLSLVTLGGPT
jgi:UDP-N-acetylglucosamine:LPS N-acetylglucosamine transferase